MKNEATPLLLIKAATKDFAMAADACHATSDIGAVGVFERLLNVLVMLVKIALSIFIAAIVSWGIHANGNFGSLGEPFATIAATLLGTSIQIGVLAGYHYTFTKTGVRSWTEWSLRAIPMMLIATGCVGFEFVHSCVIQLKGAAGEQLRLHLTNDLSRVQAQVSALDELISTTYETQMKVHLRLAQDALHGRDESGVAYGGPRYKEQMRRYFEATSRFGLLATPIPPARNWTDVNDLYQDVQARFTALAGKKEDLQALSKDVEHSPMPQSVAIAFDHTGVELGDIKRLMSELRYATPQNLAVNGTLELLQNVAHGRLEHKHDLFVLAYAAAPNLVLVLLFLYSGTAAGGAAALRQKHLQQQEELDLLKKMGKTEREIWGATEGWFSIRRLNEKWRRFLARRKSNSGLPDGLNVSA
jgi:hypothetical protein